jgi:GNAT superfamily N-acetyltransferase
LPIPHRIAKLPADRKRAGKFEKENPVIEVLQATTVKHLDDARALMRGFVAWHRKRHVADIALIDRYFDATAWEAELAGLPGKYAPSKKGSLLIAYHDGKPAGCVALHNLGGHDLGDSVAEMKRMFVPEEFRGLGVGRALADRVLADARAAGYSRMRLDTSRHQKEAIGLYERSGFKRIPPYYDLTADLRDWLVFFERPI